MHVIIDIRIHKNGSKEIVVVRVIVRVCSVVLRRTVVGVIETLPN